MFDGGDADAAQRATAAAERVFAAATAVGGSISGEHGVGTVKVPYVARQLSPAVLELQREVKRLFDPKNLLNPGKKVA
jgi:glycolate oxidase